MRSGSPSRAWPCRRCSTASARKAEADASSGTSEVPSGAWSCRVLPLMSFEDAPAYGQDRGWVRSLSNGAAAGGSALLDLQRLLEAAEVPLLAGEAGGEERLD